MSILSVFWKLANLWNSFSPLDSSINSLITVDLEAMPMILPRGLSLLIFSYKKKLISYFLLCKIGGLVMTGRVYVFWATVCETSLAIDRFLGGGVLFSFLGFVTFDFSSFGFSSVFGSSSL